MKYELTNEVKQIKNYYNETVTLYRIKALKDFGNVKKGELGGYIEKLENLSQTGDAWVSDNALVSDNACVSGNALVSDNVCVSGNACIYGNARVSGNACVSSYACVSSNADYIIIQGLGREYRATTIYKSGNNNIEVVCGCFQGTIDEFKAKIIETHGDNNYAREYNSIIETALIHFED